MEINQLYRVGVAAEKTKVGRTTILAAIKRGEIPSYETACKLPLVAIADVKKWAKVERTRGPKTGG